MNVFVRRFNPRRGVAIYTAKLRKIESKIEDNETPTEETYPDLKTFMIEHWWPHYTVSMNNRQAKFSLNLFNIDDLPEAFTIDDGTTTVVRSFAIDQMNQRVYKILEETHHNAMIHEVLKRYSGSIADPGTLTAMAEQVSMILREGLSNYYVSDKHAINDLVNSI